ncbi:MAG: hypothetical protein MUP70_13125 [Candidatus Aminicenantes bacterium]|nr:hypothetical protein [Candidatus Aminicenantes bacterium]
MRLKKLFSLVGSLLILGSGIGLTAGQQNADQKPVLNRILFIDQDGDGICDLAYDHDNDGIPNCQDPDFQRPQDGTGQMKRNGQAASFGFQHGGKGSQGMNKNSFRNGAGQFQNGVCTGSGPQGQGNRHGKK